MRRRDPRSLKDAAKRPREDGGCHPSAGYRPLVAFLRLQRAWRSRQKKPKPKPRPPHPHRAARNADRSQRLGLPGPTRRLNQAPPASALETRPEASFEENPHGTPLRGKPQREVPRGNPHELPASSVRLDRSEERLWRWRRPL